MIPLHLPPAHIVQNLLLSSPILILHLVPSITCWWLFSCWSVAQHDPLLLLVNPPCQLTIQLLLLSPCLLPGLVCLYPKWREGTVTGGREGGDHASPDRCRPGYDHLRVFSCPGGHSSSPDRSEVCKLCVYRVSPLTAGLLLWCNSLMRSQVTRGRNRLGEQGVRGETEWRDSSHCSRGEENRPRRVTVCSFWNVLTAHNLFVFSL